MEFSISYRQALYNVFSNSGSSGIGSQAYCYLNYGKGNIYNRSLIVDISKDKIEVPVFAYKAIEEEIRKGITDKVVIPLYVNTNILIKKTADAIVKAFFRYVNFADRLRQCVTEKNVIYYGGRGIILSESFTPLLYCTYIMEKDTYGEISCFTQFTPIIYINPQVFIRKDIICRHIINKLLPYYIENEVCSPYIPTIPIEKRYKKVKIIIDSSIESIIQTPIAPSPSINLDNKLNDVLVNNIADIIIE